MEFKQYLQNTEADLVGLYLHHPAMTIAELAIHAGVSRTKVYRILEKNGVIPNRISRKHNQVQTLLQQGFRDSEIAHLTGYTERNVRNIKKSLMKE